MTNLEQAIAEVKVMFSGKEAFVGGTIVGTIMNAVATGELVLAYGVERRKFYRKDWDLNTLLLARDGKLYTDGGEGWRYEYSHSDGTGGEYDMCFRLTDTVGDM